MGLYRGLLLAGVLHYGHLYLFAPVIAGGQTLIQACFRHGGQFPAPQLALIALILGRDQKPVPILMKAHIHNRFTGPGRGVDRPLPARCHVQEYDLLMVWPGKAQGQDAMDAIIDSQVNQVLRIVEAELGVQLRRGTSEEGNAVVPVDEDGQVFGCIGKERGAVVVDAVVFPHQGVIFRVPLVGVGVIAYNEPVQRGYHGGLELQLPAQV